jgi:hypothetical protein
LRIIELRLLQNDKPKELKAKTEQSTRENLQNFQSEEKQFSAAKSSSMEKRVKQREDRKTLQENDQEDCQVIVKLTLDPSDEVSKRDGESVSSVFVTAICPNCNSCVVHSTKKFLKL